MNHNADDGPKRVALYARASTTKQEYSAPGQLDDLRADANANGRQVVEEITDVGEKRHDDDRPGLNRIRDLAEAGEIDEVWAWAWDRYGELPVPEVLAVELRYSGVELRSLDDNGGGEDGELVQVIKSALSRREGRDRVRRANRGRRKKSERGELYGGFRARYGFRFVKGKNQSGTTVNVGYEPDPDTMPHIVRVFKQVASGVGLKGVRAAFERELIPNPSGGPRWSTTTIRNIINCDSYRPHAVPQLREMGISADVLGGLDQNGLYGVHWANKVRSRFRGRGKKRVTYEAPREEWVGVPVPLSGSGLDRATVDRARDQIKDNKPASKVGDRLWELSGILKCAECGRNLIAYRRKRANGGHYHAYRCRPGSRVDVEACPNRKSHRAEPVEAEVYGHIRALVDDKEMLTTKIRESFDAKRRELSRAFSDTTPLIDRLEAIDRRKDGYWQLAADGDMPRERMREKVADLDKEQEALRTALDHARHRDERLADIDRREKYFLSVVGSGPDAEPEWYELRTGEQDGEHHIVLIYGALAESMWTPEKRRNSYRELGLRVEIDAGGRITIDGELVLPSPTGNGRGEADRVANGTQSRTL